MKRTSLPLRRREFVALLGVAATWPLAARAQQASKTRRLGYLAPASIPHLIEALRSGLRELGYVEGQNLAIEYRFALGQSKTYDELAVELIRLDPDAIVVVGTPPALAAKRQTTTIPIVMAPAADPLRLRLVASLARPGGNVTGVSLYGSELARKLESDGLGCSSTLKIRYIASSGMTSSRPALRSGWSSVYSPFRTSTNSRRRSQP
jgi:putative ABC transport system substrate-binding protein